MIYREMTPEEKLEYVRQTVEVIQKDGLLGAKMLVEQWEVKLSKNILEDDYKEKVETTVSEDKRKVSEHISNPSESTKVASIYASQHMEAVQEDLKEEYKSRTFESPIATSPNPWSSATSVAPGEIQRILK